MQKDACNNWLTLVYSTIQPPKDYCLSHRQAFCDWNKQVELQEALAPNSFIGSQIKLEPVFLWCRFLHISCIFLTLFEKRHNIFLSLWIYFQKGLKHAMLSFWSQWWLNICESDLCEKFQWKFSMHSRDQFCIIPQFGVTNSKILILELS